MSEVEVEKLPLMGSALDSKSFKHDRDLDKLVHEANRNNKVKGKPKSKGRTFTSNDKRIMAGRILRFEKSTAKQRHAARMYLDNESITGGKLVQAIHYSMSKRYGRKFMDS